MEFQELVELRPTLNRETSIDTFKEYYWLKEELQTFCRNNGISASRSKIELSEQIATFLETGEIRKPVRKSKLTSLPQEALSLDTVITEHHRCSQQVRAFFKSVIPSFHFSSCIQNYFKNNVGSTYRDAVRLLPNSNTINSPGTSLPIPTTRARPESMPLKPEMKSRSFLVAINM
jgi:hypothetical protein